MKRSVALVAGLSLMASASWAQSVGNLFSRIGGGGSGSSSPTIAGGSVTGANCYRDSAGKLQCDDSILDNGSGSFTMTGGVSATGTITGTTLLAQNMLIVSTSAGVPAMIQKGGNVNVPLQWTNANGSIYAGLTTNSPGTGFCVGNNATLNSNCFLRVLGTGLVGIGFISTSPNSALDVSGTISATAIVSATSLSLTAQTTTPTTSPLGRLAINTSGTLCIVTATSVYVKVFSPASTCGFGAGSN